MAYFKKIIHSEYFVLIILWLFSIVIRGYRYGVSVHRYYLPFIFKHANENLYTKDFMFDFNTENSLLFTFLGKLSNYINLEVLLFFLYLFFSLLLVLAIYKLSMYLFNNKYVSYIAILLLIISKPSFATDLTFRDMFFPITATIPLLLFSIYFFLKEKYLIAFTLLGISFDIHGLTSSHILGIYLTYFVLKFKSINKKYFIYGLLIFSLLVIPTIAYSETTNLSFYNSDAHWVTILRERDQSHTFPSNWSLLSYRPTVPLVLLGILVFLYCFKHRKEFPDLRRHTQLLILLFGIFCLLLFSYVFVEIYPIDIVIPFQLFRSTLFLMIFLMIYTAFFIYSMVVSKHLFKTFIGAVTLSALFFYDHIMLVAILPLLFVALFFTKDKFYWLVSGAYILGTWLILISYKELLTKLFIHIASNLATLLLLTLLFLSYIYCKQHYKKIPQEKLVLLLLLLFLLFSSFTAIFINRNVLDPYTSFRAQVQFPSYVQTNSRFAMEDWIQEYTPLDALFLAPPFMYEFRSNTQRSLFFANGIFNGHYSKELSYEWERREKALGIPRTISVAEMDKLYNNMTEEKINSLKETYNITHAVFTANRSLSYPEVYSNQDYVVYCLVC